MQLVTILESSEADRTAHVQINEDTLIGSGVPGGNARHTFSTEKDADEPWKGTVQASVAAFYPGAEIHTVDTLNAKVEGIYVAKGLLVKISSGLVTPEEKKRLDQIAADAKTVSDAAAIVAAQADGAVSEAKLAVSFTTAALAAAPTDQSAIEAQAAAAAGLESAKQAATTARAIADQTAVVAKTAASSAI